MTHVLFVVRLPGKHEEVESHLWIVLDRTRKPLVNYTTSIYVRGSL
jgi:hypothetical protein